MNSSKQDKGFTLIELLAVLVILAALATLAIPIFGNKSDTAKQLAHNENVRMLQMQAQMYLLNEQVTLPQENIITDMVAKGYIKSIPENPYKSIQNYKEKSYIVGISSSGVSTATLTIGHNGICNMPDLVNGMTPLIFEGSDFRAATAEEIENKSWYNYRADLDQPQADRVANERWANVELKDGSMFVWIPRYTYKITKNGASSSIDIIYSNGTTDDTQGGTYKAHPAFNFGGVQLTGIWVAKFEASAMNGQQGTNGDKVQVKPGVASWRSLTVNDIFNACRNMQLVNSGTYGISSDPTVVDIHMMKNSEWGAVAYLTEAIRDRDEVGINDNTSYYTGGSNTVATIYTNATNKEMSSTGNAYGVYDLNGGTWEYVASYIGVPNTGSTPGSNGTSLINADSKYKDVLAGAISEEQQTNYAGTEGSTDGWALHEVMTAGMGASTFQGYSDYQNFPYGTSPLFVRGGNCDTEPYAGVFASAHDGGAAYSYRSFRPVLVGLN